MLGLSNGLAWQGFVEQRAGKAIKFSGKATNSSQTYTYDTPFVDFGNCLQLGTNDFTISCWFKLDDFTNPNGASALDDSIYLIAKHGNHLATGYNNDDGIIALYLSAGRMRFLVRDDNGQVFITKNVETDILSFLAGTCGGDGQPSCNTYNHEKVQFGTWYHFCVSVDRSGNCVTYFNGQPTANFSTLDISSSSSDTFNNNGHWRINTLDDIDGPIQPTYRIPNTYFDECAIWNSALDADNVAAIYNSGNPINLLADSGDYDESSALQGYWKFGDGVGDVTSPYSVFGWYCTPASGCDPEVDKFNEGYKRFIIRDQTNTGFGSELWDVTQPSTGSWTAYGNNTVAVDDGAIKITYVDNAYGAKAVLSNATNLSAALEDSGWDTPGARHFYKLSFKIKVNSGGSVDFEARISPSSTHYNRSLSPITNTEFQEIDFYIEGEDDTSDSTNYIQFHGMSSGDIVWIKDISVKKLNGNPGIVQEAHHDLSSHDGEGKAEFVSDAPIPAQA